MDDAEGQSAVPASSGAPAATGAPDALQWTQAVQQWQAQAQAMQGNQQRKNGAQAPPPFYPLGAAHPYSLYQPLMAYPPFYNMPFPYPPAASGAQVPSEPAAGPSVAEKKPGETNGQSKSGDDSSPPNSNVDSEQPARTASGGVKAEQHPQSQPEAVPYQALVPTDATVNSAALAALAAAQAAAASGPDAAEFWRQRAGQLAGSGVDLTQLAASAAGQSHVVQDERELKRQRRKQSNRESARRSRLRKQAECEGLGQKVLDLEAENVKLKETIAVLQAQLDAALGKTAAAAPAASQPAS
ncbi:g8240 [Coccomyxa elongata]